MQLLQCMCKAGNPSETEARSPPGVPAAGGAVLGASSAAAAVEALEKRLRSIRTAAVTPRRLQLNSTSGCTTPTRPHSEQ